MSGSLVSGAARTEQVSGAVCGDGQHTRVIALFALTTPGIRLKTRAARASKQLVAIRESGRTTAVHSQRELLLRSFVRLSVRPSVRSSVLSFVLLFFRSYDFPAFVGC